MRLIEGTAAAEGKAQSGITMEVDRLFDALGYLEERVDRLSTKLDAVLLPEGPTQGFGEKDAGQDEIPEMSPVTLRIRRAHDNVRVQAGRISDLVERVDL